MGVMLFPNPAHNKVTLRWGNRAVQQFTVYNSMGQLVLQKNCGNESASSLDVSGWQQGLYTLILRDKEGYTYRQVLIKQ